MNVLKYIKIHEFYKRNVSGVDYFIGDIHGEYSLFISLLKHLDFDEERDRIFSVGDLIDRGGFSYECLMLAGKKWFIPVIGNHEEMLLKSVNNKFIHDLWVKNGGDWWLKLCESKKNKCLNLILQKFTLTATIETQFDLVGLLHADYLEPAWPPSPDRINEGLIKNILWGREIISNKIINYVDNVDFIISGHTPLELPEKLGANLFIDTGCGHLENKYIPQPKLTALTFKNGKIVCHMLDKHNYYQTIQL